MRILSNEEVALWLAEHNLPARPYDEGASTFEFYLQFHAPQRFRGLESFADGILELAAPGAEVLLTVTDMIMPWDYEEKLFDRIRRSFGGSVPDGDGGAHLFPGAESRECIPIFSLTAAWQWEAYLHMPQSRTVVLNWQGDILDVWTDERSVFDGISGMVDAFELTYTDSFRKRLDRGQK